MRIGCCIDLKQIETVCAIGYDFIDLNGQELAKSTAEQRREALRRMEDGGVFCAGLHATVPASVKLAGPDYSAAAAEDYFALLAERSEPFHPRCIGIGSPNSRKLPEGFDRSEADEQLLCSLRAALRAFPEGEILLEALNPLETNYINSYDEALSLLDKLHEPRAGAVLDLYHFALCGDRPEAFGDADYARARYLHIADPDHGRAYPSPKLTPAFVQMTEEILAKTNCECIAVEALTDRFEADAETALNTMRKLTKGE